MDNMLRKALWDILRPLIQLITNLLNPEIGEEWLRELKKFLRKESCWALTVESVKELTNQYLRRIPGGQGLKVKTTTGERFIAKAKSIFPGYIDSDFVNWNLDHTGQATPEALADVWELVKDSTFNQFFQGFGKGLDELCWSQDQIISFCEDHRQWLCTDGYATFFLLKENGGYFVARVFFGGDGELGVIMDRLSHDYVWLAERRFRVVLPQL